MGKPLKDKEYFRKMFREEMGEADRVNAVDIALLEKYRELLPDELLMYWKKYGFTSFKQGMFWLTNPADYGYLVKTYLASTPLINRKNLYVIARSAFGHLYLWEKDKGNICDIRILSNMVFFDAKSEQQNLSIEDEEYEMNRFIGTNDTDILDIKDSSRTPLFERCLKKLGQLEINEMYGYKFNPAFGGKEGILNLDKVNLFVYADIQLGIETPSFNIINTIQ